MTVLEEGGDSYAPPHKRPCLSYRYPVLQTYQMATPLDAGVMLNGYGLVDSHKNHSPDDSSANSEGVSPVATLCNLGNTCFLNSVLYTLRFAPAFLHNLHHLALDLVEYSGRYSHLKSKSSSLGRGIGGGSKSWSNKDLPSVGQLNPQEDRIALATLRLHELYEGLHSAELKDHMEPYQPEVFLTALREVNSIFEGNQQHDAHELLVCLLDNIRETCRQLSQLSERQRCIIPPQPPCPLPPAKSSSFTSNVRKSLKLGRAKSNGVYDKKHTIDGPLINGETNLITNEEEVPRVGHNFISEDFQGVTLLRTTCLECEQVTERKETFCDICVPITTPSGNYEEGISSLYHSAMVTEELLQDTNKYWCEQCLRYNEARRCVRFESLPQLLVLQLKRFSSSYGSVVSKVNDFMPTPLTLSCFCLKCKDVEENKKIHHAYQLYGVIMHLGATMASGHYVAYVCGRDTAIDCAKCTRDKRKTASLSGGAGKQASNNAAEKHSGGLLRFFKSTKQSYQHTLSGVDGRGPYFSPCRSADCCGVKLDPGHEPTWLECDDETVRTLSRKQLEEILAPPKSVKNSALTPYLLFYCRLP
uniref:USP domain-containing protein n=1 Tax=Graphocephala atropunctata TaxID=36148 RepID=A0A1B6MTU9_9HEMI